MTNYIWAVSAGGTITAGGTTNSNTVTVTWSTTGAQSVSVKYNNSSGCTSALATVYNVTVNALPSPTLTGPASVCVNYTGNVYNTQAGMTNYVWSVSAGGTITAGGTSTSSIVTVTWNTTGAQTVSVNYSNSNGCNAAAPTVYNVTVNALPSPAITGPASVCFNSTGNVYTTQAGLTNYVWSVSAGGTITAGGSTTSNTVTVTWSATGTQTVSIKYTNANGCTNAVATVYNVTVNALPSPTLTGPASVCFNSTGNVYTTQAGMTNYNWAVSAGGTITAGGSTTSSTVTVTWSATGTQTVSVKYTNANGCTNAVATVYNVTVNALPSPTITGPASACVNSAGNVYTTEIGMTSYTWSISASGLITSGTGTNSITVTWNIAGAQTVSVNYTNGNGCMASSATIKNVTINPLPVPILTGLATLCAGTTGVIYSTDPGMTGYTWSVSTGGTITAGSGTSAITVTWTTAGAKTVNVNYTNPNGCTGLSPTVKNVTVNPVPVPTISGPNPVCMDINVTYITESGMTSYIWILSAGGVITAGAGTNAISVVWASAGTQTVSVNYTNSYGCTASSATVYNITVNPLPVPTITGSGSVCAGATGVTYTTETGMTAYTWTISAGGTITSGTGTSTITVIWNTTGAQTVSVNYVNSNGCTATSATVKNVTVNALPVPTIIGAAAVCAGTTGVNYTTQAGMTSYSWSISASGVITSGTGSNSIMVTWTTAGSQTISVNYFNSNGCTASSPTVKNVTVNPLPVPTITGSVKLCAGTSGVNYSTETGMTGYIWSVSAGGTITAGAGTDQITVTWSIAG
jgi:glucokinase